jgi:hypothetical protein
VKQPQRRLGLEQSLRKHLIWYPRDWREKNAEAFIGVWLELAENQGVRRLTPTKSIELILGGLVHRLLRFEPVTLGSRVVLFVGLLFGFVYSFGIAWTPRSLVSGGLGHFANPEIVTTLLLTLACLSAFADRGATARWLSLCAFSSNLVITICALKFHWMGPSLYAAGLFALFCLAGMWRNRSPRNILARN